MGQSLVKNYIHVIFSTKQRMPLLIRQPVQDELNSYIGVICRGMECQPIKYGGFTDHIHILCFIKEDCFNEVIGGSEITFVKVDENERHNIKKLLLAEWIRSVFSKSNGN